MSPSPIVFSLEDPTFRALLDLAPGAIGISRLGKALYANPAYRKLFGYSPEEDLRGWPVMDHFSPKVRPEIERRIKDHAQTTWKTDRVETRGVRRDGTEFDLGCVVLFIQLGDGPAALSFLSDISDRKEVETALHEQEARFKAIFQNAAIGMALVAMDRTPILANPAMQGMLGYTESELQKMTIDQFSVPEDDKQGVALLKEIAEGRRESYNTEKRYRRKDGTVLWVSLTVSVVRGPNRKPHYLIGMIEYITDRKGKA